MRRAHHNESSAMSGILGPDARKPPPRNFHRENLQKMHQREQEIQMKRDQDASRQQEQQGPWKMKRFQSVESKVSNNLRAGGLSDAGDGTSIGQRKMTKAEQMKLRMQQERGASDYVGSPPQ